MIIEPISIAGAFVIKPETASDERGGFRRVWCEREFREHGLATRIAQCSLSQTKRRGTIRGLHYQVAPHEETKVVSCVKGAIYDVVVDLRRDSPTYFRHFSITLDDQEGQMLYIPEGCAHGFETLVDDVEVYYQISACYSAEHARGVRWNDPALAIAWPEPPQVLSARDRSFADYSAPEGADRSAELSSSRC